jgi:hypothetical protein
MRPFTASAVTTEFLAIPRDLRMAEGSVICPRSETTRLSFTAIIRIAELRIFCHPSPGYGSIV